MGFGYPGRAVLMPGPAQPSRRPAVEYTRRTMRHRPHEAADRRVLARAKGDRRDGISLRSTEAMIDDEAAARRWRTKAAAVAEAAFPRDAGPLGGDVAIAAVLALTGAIVQVLRLPHGAALDGIWAEDGAVFLRQAVTVGARRAITVPYAGYMHLWPRLVAAVAAAAPPGRAAAVFGGAAAATVGLTSGLVFVAARSHLPSRVPRLALAAGMAFLPVAGFEMLANVANVQWYLLVASMWLLLWRPQRALWAVVSLVICFVTAASEPMAAVLLAPAAVRVVASRRPVDLGPAVGLVGGLAWQGWVAASTPHPVSAVRPGITDLGSAYAVRGAVTGFLGSSLGQRLFGVLGWALAGLAVVAVVAVVALAFASRQRLSPVVTTLFVLTHLALFAIPFFIRWTPVDRPLPSHPERLSVDGRYEAVPLLLLWGLAALVLDSLPAAARWRAGLRATALTMLLLVCGADLMASGPRGSAPSWRAGVLAARQTCRGSDAETVQVPIAPEGWAADVPCTWLVR